jgi:hypothetical protein
MADNEGEAPIDGDAEVPHPPEAEEQPNADVNQPQEGGETPLGQGSDDHDWDADEHFAWDGQPPKEETREQRRNELDKAIKTYIKDWRVFQEMLQNAIDSFVDVETGELYAGFSGDYTPTIDILVDASTNTISISDNGIGIPSENRFFLTKAYSGGKNIDDLEENVTKRRAIKGSQGIGLKASVYSSSSFSVHSESIQQPGGGWKWSQEGLYNVPKTGTPIGEDIAAPIPEPRPEGHGTTVIMQEGYDEDPNRYDNDQPGWHVMDFLQDKILTWMPYFNLEGVDYSIELDVLDKMEKSVKKNRSIERHSKSIKKQEGILKKLDSKDSPTNSEINLLVKTRKKISQLKAKVKEWESERKELSDFINSKKPDKLFTEKIASLHKLGETDPEIKKMIAEAREDKSLINLCWLSLKFSPPTKENMLVFSKGLAGTVAFKASLGRIFEHYLLSRTYAADLSRVLGVNLPEVIINYEIKLSDEQIKFLKYVKPESNHTGSVIVGYRTVNVARNQVREMDFVDHITEFVNDDKLFVADANHIAWCGEKNRTNQRGKVFEGIWKTKDEIENSLATIDKESKEGDIRRVSLSVEDRIEIAAGLKHINGIYCIIAASHTLKNRLGIAAVQDYSVNGLPVGVQIKLDRAGNLAARSQVHLIVDIDTHLGIGKRNMGLHGNQLNSISKVMVMFWNHTIAPIARAVSGLEGKDDTGLSEFSDEAKELIDHPASFEVMIEHFGRLTIPTSEQDIIQMHSYYMGKHNLNPNWLALSTGTNVDAVSLPRFQQGEFEQDFRIEYKGPNSSYVLLDNQQNSLSKQRFNDYQIAVIWDMPDDEKLKNFDWKHYHADGPKAQKKYPELDAFERKYMSRISDGHTTTYFFSLKKLFEHLVQEKIQSTQGTKPEASSSPADPEKADKKESDSLGGMFDQWLKDKQQS